jgi:hypothetical protein
MIIKPLFEEEYALFECDTCSLGIVTYRFGYAPDGSLAHWGECNDCHEQHELLYIDKIKDPSNLRDLVART